MDHGRVLALDHEHRLFEQQSLDFISQHGKRIEPKTSLVLEALWMNCAWILIRGNLLRPPVNHERLLQLREHDDSADRRPGGRGKQTVVAARVETDDG